MVVGFANCGVLSHTINEVDVSAESLMCAPYKPERTSLTSKMSFLSREGKSALKIAKDKLCKIDELCKGINPVMKTLLLSSRMACGERTIGSRRCTGGIGAVVWLLLSNLVCNYNYYYSLVALSLNAYDYLN